MGNLGWTEILIILVIALIVFGPRKLPELGKSLGQSLAQFRRASEDFKRTWEDEVEMEKRRLEPATPPEPTPELDHNLDPIYYPNDSTGAADADGAGPAPAQEGSELASKQEQATTVQGEAK
jgi:sec-independent protein translocase protein TatA